MGYVGIYRTQVPAPYINIIMDDRHVPEDAVQGDLVGNLVIDTNIEGYSLAIVELGSKFQLNVLRVERSAIGTIVAGVDEAVTIRATYPGGSNDFPFVILVDADNVPIGISLDNSDIVDTAIAGTLVGNLTALGGVAPITWSRSGNTNFDISGSQLVRSATGTITAGVPEVVTLRATDFNGAFFEQSVSLTVTPVAPGGVVASWLNPPPVPARKIKVHWNGPGDISISPAMNEWLVESANCWIVENIAGMDVWDGQTFNSVDQLYSVIAPTLDLEGCEAEFDPGYVAQGSNGLTLDTPAVNWTWSCATPWSHTYPYAGGFLYRVLLGHSIHEVTVDDSSFTSTMVFKNWKFTTFPCESAKATGLTCAPGSTVGGNTLTASSIGIQPDYDNQYPTEVYRLMFDAATLTPGLRSKQYTIIANGTGATPSLTIAGTWTSSTLPVAGDTARIVASKQAGDDLFYIVRVGLLYREHCLIARGGFNGTAVSLKYEWDLRTQARLYDHDCLYYGNGGTPLQHNNYIHHLRLYAARRCFSYNACGASWKAECDAFILDDCTAAGHLFDGTVLQGNAGWGNNNSVCDCQQHVRAYYRNVRVIPTNFDNTWKKRHWSTIQMRLSNWSSHSRLLPTPVAKNLVPGQSTAVIFKYGTPDQATTTTAQVGVGTSGSFLVLEKLGGLLNSGQQSRTLSNFAVDAYDIQLYYDDGTIYTGRFTQLVGGATPNGTLNPPLAKSASRYRPVIIKLVADNWDYPVVDISARDFNDPASPTYLWTPGGANSIIANDGSLDLTKQNGPVWGYPAQYYDGCFVTPTHQALSQCGIVQVTKDCYNGTFNQNSAVVQVPLPPLKSTDGSWSDPANSGEWNGQLHVSAPGIGSDGSGGLGYAGTDFVRPNFGASRHMTWWTKGMTAFSFDVDTTQGSAAQPLAFDNIPLLFMAVLSTGVVNAAQNQLQKLFESPVMFQAAGDADPGANSVVVDNVEGLSVGMFLAAACDNQWGSDLGVHAGDHVLGVFTDCRITGINPGTKTVTFSPPLPTGTNTFKAIKSGYKMAALPYATWPGWALNPEVDF